MKGSATAFGGGTIVNAIAIGRGAAFGIALRATATVETRPAEYGVRAHVPPGVDPALATYAAQRVRLRSGERPGLDVTLNSEIPISRGLKSSSAVANAVVLACGQALGMKLDPMEVVATSVDAGFDAGVTITGAFDDACASLLGGICVTDNGERRLLALDRFPDDLVAVVQIPRQMTSKKDLQKTDFSSIRSQVEAALHHALRGDYFRALEANSAAYAPILGVDEAPARRAREAGAKSAGLTGTGPAIIALATYARTDAVRKAMEDGVSEVRVVALDTMASREVIL
jgi:shikimate kinase